MDHCVPEFEQQMQRYYQSLSEKNRRRYAAIEVLKLVHGGISYISRLFACHAKPTRGGIAEFQDEHVLRDQRIRQARGGGKRVLETIKGLSAAFWRVIEHHTAGSPMDEWIKWTHPSRQQIADLLLKKERLSVSVTVIDQLLKQHDFIIVKRSIPKLSKSIPDAMTNLRRLSGWSRTTSKRAIQ